MTIQLSTAVRNGMANAIEAAVGASAIMRIFSGAAPANAAAANSGTELATLTLPSDWMAAASSGSVAMIGTWQDLSANATGVAGHYRIYASDGTTCHIQGTVGTSGADLIVDNTNFAAGQAFNITAFSLTVNNA